MSKYWNIRWEKLSFTWEIIRAAWQSRDRRASWRPSPRTQRPRWCPPRRPSRWCRAPPGPGWPAAWTGWGRWRGSWGSDCSASWSPQMVSWGGGNQPAASTAESSGNMTWSPGSQCSRSPTRSRTLLHKILWSPSSLKIFISLKSSGCVAERQCNTNLVCKVSIAI